MNQQIKEALALEITKATIADKDPLSNDLTNAELWVSTFNEALKAVNEVDKRNAPPARSVPFKMVY